MIIMMHHIEIAELSLGIKIMKILFRKDKEESLIDELIDQDRSFDTKSDNSKKLVKKIKIHSQINFKVRVDFVFEFFLCYAHGFL